MAVTFRDGPSASDDIVQQVEYGYDALNRRNWRAHSIPGVSYLRELYAYDGHDILLEQHQTSPSSFAYFTYAHFWLPNGEQSLLLSRETIWESLLVRRTQWALADGQGTYRDFVSATWDSSPEHLFRSGHIVYDTYGSIINIYNNWWSPYNSTNPGIRYTWAGLELDYLTGLHMADNRQYDAKLGKWTAEDPIGFAGGQWNVSMYVGNDPVNYTDRSGLSAWDFIVDTMIDTENVLRYGWNTFIAPQPLQMDYLKRENVDAGFSYMGQSGLNSVNAATDLPRVAYNSSAYVWNSSPQRFGQLEYIPYNRKYDGWSQNQFYKQSDQEHDASVEGWQQEIVTTACTSAAGKLLPLTMRGSAPGASAEMKVAGKAATSELSASEKADNVAKFNQLIKGKSSCSNAQEEIFDVFRRNPTPTLPQTVPTQPTITDRLKVSVPRTASGAESAAQYAKLKEFYRQAQDYGAGGVKQLENGQFRFYGKLDPADKVGEMAGRRFVKEWDPITGAKRGWHDTVDHNGRVRIVRPEPRLPQGHFIFDAQGNYVGTRP